MDFIVIVGASKNARGRYAEFSGYNYFGPMSRSDAETFKAKVEATWAEKDKAGFVYGEPEVKIEPITAVTEDIETRARRAADNWYLESE